MCSETSPRISFSNDLIQQDEEDSLIHRELRRDCNLLESNSDFEFSICSSLDHQSSSADELFADGIILPAFQVSDSNPTHLKNVYTPPLPCNYENLKREDRILNTELEEKNQSKSFWGFKRSSSLNCDIKKSLICSLPLLSRSNSTGSAPNPNPKQKATPYKQNSQKQQLGKKVSGSNSTNYVYSLPQKPPLKRYYGGSNGNGVKMNPVLNVPPPYIGKGTASLFGLGSFLRNGKEKNRR